MNIPFKLIALFACIPLVFSAIYCLKLDFSTAYPLSGDFVGRLSVNSWIYFIVLTIVVLLLYQVLADRWRWVIPFLLAVVFVVAFPLAQYPSVQNSDAYMHAGAARSLVEHGAIPEMTLYSEYPGSFIILAVLSQVLNIPLLETSMLLSSIINLLIVYLLIVLGELTIGKKWSWLVPTFYLVFSFRHYTTLVHYSPQLLGLTLYILFFIVLIHVLRSPLRQWKAILIVLTAVIIVTHPFSAVFVVFSFFGIYLLTGRTRSPWRFARNLRLRARRRSIVSVSLLMLAITFFVGWHVFFAKEVLNLSIEFLPSIFKTGFRIVTEEDIVYGAPSGLLGTVLQFYRLGIYAFLGALAAFGLFLFRKNIEVKLIFGLVGGLLLGALLMVFSPAAHYAVGRTLIYGGVLVSLLSPYVLANLHNASTAKKILAGSKRALPLLVLTTFLVSQVYTSVYVSFVHAEDVAVSTFAVQKVDGTFFTPITQAMVVFYYGGNISLIKVVRNDADADLARLKFSRGNLSIQDSPRQIYYFNFSFVESLNNVVYSNGNNRFYSLANTTSS